MSNCKTCLETVDIYTYIAPLNMTIYTFVLGYKYIIIIGIHQAPVAIQQSILLIIIQMLLDS